MIDLPEIDGKKSKIPEKADHASGVANTQQLTYG